MVVGRPLVVRVNIGSLQRYVRLASYLIRKSAATNLAGFVCCVPALFQTSTIGFHFSDAMWRKMIHDDFPPFRWLKCRSPMCIRDDGTLPYPRLSLLCSLHRQCHRLTSSRIRSPCRRRACPALPRAPRAARGRANADADRIRPRTSIFGVPCASQWHHRCHCRERRLRYVAVFWQHSGKPLLLSM
jgi:hypothetical protein